jgi:hypothetical protein
MPSAPGGFPIKPTTIRVELQPSRAAAVNIISTVDLTNSVRFVVG